MVKNYKVNILLNDERDARTFSEEGNLVHQKELEQIQKMIIETLGKARGYADSFRETSAYPIPGQRHDTIMLAGVRGSGKTSFMLSVLDRLQNGWKGTKGFSNDIEVLEMLDPTLLENNVHILVHIVSMIKNKVDIKAQKGNFFDGDNSDHNKIRTWETSFRRLAEGLSNIDGVGDNTFSGDAWMDSAFVMNQGVQRAHAANMLERYFHSFVHHSLEFLNKKAFFLCFDDIDTNFIKGWPVLETIHKYLTTPQVITVLSGDPELYSLLIRDRQWGNFSNKMIELEEDRSRFQNMVTHLEEQYFLKLLSPERRILLTSLYQKELGGEYTIHIEGSGNQSKPLSLRKAYVEIFKCFGIMSSGQQEGYFRFLSSQPMRTQIQLLHAWDNFISDPAMLSRRLLEIFWSDLSEKKVSVSELRTTSLHPVAHILDYLVKNNVLMEGHLLSPIFSDPLLNAAQFSLGALVSSSVKKDPSQVFDFWIRISLVREFGGLLSSADAVHTNGPSLQNLIEHCSIKGNRSVRYIARHVTAYMRAYRGYPQATRYYDNNSWHGTLPLYGLYEKVQDTIHKEKRIDFIFKGATNLEKAIAYLPLSGATTHSGVTLPVYSFYNFLGVLGEIVQLARNSSELSVIDSVSGLLLKSTQIREYPVPRWASPVGVVEEGRYAEDDEFRELEHAKDEALQDKQLKLFVEKLVQWSRSADNITVSSGVLGKIFTRLFYSLNNMDSKLSIEESLGNWMTRMVIAFLNAVVVVEALETMKLSEVPLRLNNPVTDDEIFEINLKQLNARGAEGEVLSLSKWLVACPLWQCYLEKTPEGLEEFISSKEQGTQESFKEDCVQGVNLYHYLQRVHVKQLSSTGQATNTNVDKKKTPEVFDIKKHADFFIEKCIEMGKSQTQIRDMRTSDFNTFLKLIIKKRYGCNLRKQYKKSINRMIDKKELTWDLT